MLIWVDRSAPCCTPHLLRKLHTHANQHTDIHPYAPRCMHEAHLLALRLVTAHTHNHKHRVTHTHTEKCMQGIPMHSALQVFCQLASGTDECHGHRIHPLASRYAVPVCSVCLLFHAEWFWHCLDKFLCGSGNDFQHWLCADSSVSCWYAGPGHLQVSWGGVIRF